MAESRDDEDVGRSLEALDVGSDPDLRDIFHAILAADVDESEEAGASSTRNFTRDNVDDFLQQLNRNPNMASVHALPCIVVARV